MANTMTDSTEQYQINKLPIDLADAAERYAEALAAAQKLTPHTFAPLRLLSLLDEVTFACDDMRELLDVALDVLERNADGDPAGAVLKGARAMNSQQAERIWELVGLVLRHMLEQASAPPRNVLPLHAAEH
jgi:hypothetical protein